MNKFLNILKKNNCELVSEYKKSTIKVDIRCECGTIFSRIPRGCYKPDKVKCKFCLYPYNIKNIDDILNPQYIECFNKLLECVDKFSSIKNGDCIEWSGSLDNNNRAKIRCGKNFTTAARVVFVVKNKSPLKNLHVLHKCDNPKCVNPDHLFLGTHKDNMLDKENKNRGNRKNPVRGEKCSFAKIKAKDVLEIRSSDKKYEELSKIYKISIAQVSRIRNNKLWKSV